MHQATKLENQQSIDRDATPPIVLKLTKDYYKTLTPKTVESKVEYTPVNAVQVQSQPRYTEVSSYNVEPTRSEKLESDPEFMLDSISMQTIAPNVLNDITELETTYIKDQPIKLIKLGDSTESIYREQESVIFDEQAMSTFNELMHIQLIQEDMYSIADLETQEIFTQDINVINKLETKIALEHELFENFGLVELPNDFIPNIELVISGAEDRSIEETLLQLSVCVSENSQGPNAKIIENTLEDIAQTILEANSNSLSIETSHIITPELIQKLFMLIRAVGYEDPREILLDFTSRHSLDLLLKIIQYLYQLTDDKNRHELSPKLSSSLTHLNTDDNLSARLGRTIGQYLFFYKIIPEA